MKYEIRFVFPCGLVVVVSCQPRQKKPMESMDQLLTTDQSQISYSDCGQGEIVLFFVHGWNINRSYWSAQQDEFCSTYRIVSMDLPGFGESKNIRVAYSIESYGNDVKALIKHLDLKHVVLIGHSMGGRVILEAAQKNDRIIGLVGVDNFKSVSQRMTPELKAEVDGFMDLLRADFANHSPAYAEQYLIHPEADSTVSKRIVNDYSSVNPASSILAIKAYFDPEYQEQKRLSGLDLPLFIISSNMSPLDTIGLENTGLKYTVYGMEKTGHFPMVERPKLFNKLLAQALEQLVIRKKE